MIDSWNLGRRTLKLNRRPLVMGILNVTPDSFSDGGKHNAVDAAVATAMQMVQDGVDIIDIGGESTRPYSEPVDAETETSRVVPVIEKLVGEISVPISIDTSKASVARASLAAGAEIINDVTGLEGDAEMPEVATATQAAVCVMHMQGTPQTMQDDPSYTNVVEDIFQYLKQRADQCLKHGIARDQICLDPGIGFGKTHEHNLTLLRSTRRFTELGFPILIGHSRKGFIGKLIGDKTADRTAATIGVSLAVAAGGANIIRVHDVKPTVDALTLFEASGGLSDSI